MTLYYDTGFIHLLWGDTVSYRISEFADKCDVNKETIRYYERKGLIQEPARTKSGYRIYSEDAVNRVGFIKRMQELGFSLKDRKSTRLNSSHVAISYAVF